MYQQITIIGHVGRDPEMRYTSSGVGVCSFSVAVNRHWTDKNTNERREKTTWFKVSAWRQLGETCSQYVRKGMLILVVGDEVQASAYTSRDGTPQVSLEITARDVKFLSSRQGEAGAVGEEEYSAHGHADEPDDIPF